MNMTYRSYVLMVAAAALVTASGSMAGQEAGKVDFSKAKLRNPAQLTETAPDTYKAEFDTTKGKFVVEVHRSWAPNGADRFYNLVKNGFFTDVRFFRVIQGFMVQFGINADPKVSAPWREARIPDDKVTQSNKRGFITFATSGPNSRTTQVF